MWIIAIVVLSPALLAALMPSMQRRKSAIERQATAEKTIQRGIVISGHPAFAYHQHEPMACCICPEESEPIDGTEGAYYYNPSLN